MKQQKIQGRIIIDATAYSVVVRCADCKKWGEVVCTRGRALQVAALHLRYSHNDPAAARRVAELVRRAERRKRKA